MALRHDFAAASASQRRRTCHASVLPEMALESGFVEKVIMTEVVELLPDDILHTTLGEVRRGLKRDGVFTGTVPYCEDRKTSELICPFCHAIFVRWGHHQRFDAASLRDVPVQHRLRIKRNYPHSFPDFTRRGLRLFLRASFRNVFRRMGEPLVEPNVYFVAVRG